MRHPSILGRRARALRGLRFDARAHELDYDASAVNRPHDFDLDSFEIGLDTFFEHALALPGFAGVGGLAPDSLDVDYSDVRQARRESLGIPPM